MKQQVDNRYNNEMGASGASELENFDILQSKNWKLKRGRAPDAPPLDLPLDWAGERTFQAGENAS